MGGRPGPARTWQGPNAISTAVVGGGANTCGAPMSALNRGRCTPSRWATATRIMCSRLVLAQRIEKGALVQHVKLLEQAQCTPPKVLAPRTLRSRSDVLDDRRWCSVGHRMNWRSPRRGRHKNCRSGNGTAAVEEPVIPPVAPSCEARDDSHGSLFFFFKRARAQSSLLQNGNGHIICTRVKDDPPTHQDNARL